MAKVYCSVEQCFNRLDKEKDIRFFKLPPDTERREQWLQVIGRSDLQKRPGLKFTSYCVCSAHFEESCLITKKYLTPNAMPTKLLPGTLAKDDNEASTSSKLEMTKVYEVKKAGSQKQNTLYKPVGENNIKKELISSFKDENKASTLSKLKTKHYKIKEENKEQNTLFKAIGHKDFEDNDEASTSSEPKKAKLDNNKEKETQNMSLNLADWQIKIKEEVISKLFSETPIEASTLSEPQNTNIDNNKEKEEKAQNTFLKLADWQKKIKELKGSAEHKEFALNLYFASPHTYRLLKTLFELPNVGTLHTLRIKVPLRLDDRVISSLSLKMKSFPTQAKYCTMCIGEMKLKPHLYYDNKEDDLIGFHSIDGKVTNKIATRAYVIMLQGLFHKWTQPLSYAFLPETDQPEELGSWVDNMILTLQKIDIEVMALISDQDSNFNRFAKDFKGVTIEKPYFFLNERKVYYIFNVPLLLCSVRDAMEATNFIYEQNVISWDYIQMLYNKENKNGLSLIPKLTIAHVRPENDVFQKPRVELAAQVFSRTVATAMNTHIDYKTLPEEARATAKFILSLDNLFDVLNSSRARSDNPLQLPLKGGVEQRNVLKEGLKLFSLIKTKDIKVGPISISETFDNFQITIKAIWQMHKDLSKLGFQQLFTRRLNKDNLEVLFRSVVWQETAGPKPTAAKFTKAFSKLFLTSLLQNTPCNCSDLLANAEDVLSQAYKLKKKPAPPTSMLLNPADQDYQMQLPLANALTYISGYLIYKCFEHHKCEGSAIFNRTTPLLEPALFAHYKDLNTKAPFNGKLRMPPPKFVKYVGRMETAFVNQCMFLIEERPGSKILEGVMATPEDPVALCSCFPIEYCVKLFVRLRIYTTLRYNQREIRTGQRVISVEHL